MKKKIYIIGNLPLFIDDHCQSKYYRVQMNLNQMGFTVVNPVERLIDKNLSYDDSIKKNLQDLMFCDAVYIMPCFCYQKAKRNLELKWAIDCNLLIINGIVDVTSNNQELTNGNKYKRKRKVVK